VLVQNGLHGQKQGRKGRQSCSFRRKEVLNIHEELIKFLSAPASMHHLDCALKVDHCTSIFEAHPVNKMEAATTLEGHEKLVQFAHALWEKEKVQKGSAGKTLLRCATRLESSCLRLGSGDV
jgi:hypothetical protein